MDDEDQDGCEAPLVLPLTYPVGARIGAACDCARVGARVAAQYRVALRTDARSRVLYLCRGCALRLAVLILEREVG